jgi:hypothetical protein
MHHHRTVAIAAGPLALLAGALLLAGCDAGALGSTDPSTAGPTPTPELTAVGQPATLNAGDQDNGRRVTAHVGDHLLLTLNSTYWTIQGSSNPAVLRQSGQPVVSPILSGCVPGQGCGTVRASFDAVAPGAADVTASRTSCGEALACTGGAGSYRVTVLVTP